ncbi:hypothetical protein NXF25_015401 [Crotalus adamanteus]|uniref:S100P-binding protein n=1 Tax=Crotalus adamanteus TaxID=8729 RepID=A0AAW1AY76_CROAD
MCNLRRGGGKPCLNFLKTEIAGSGSKRHLEEECEEGGAADTKRQRCMTCRCSSSQAHSLSSGRAASPGSFLSSGGCLDNDLDDAILARSDEDMPDSPTGLSREAEDELIAEDLETPPCFVAVEVNSCEDVKRGSLLACPEPAQPLRALDEVESTKPLPQTASSASSMSTHVNGQRNDCVEVPDVKITNSPVKPKRILIQEADLESRKARYVNAVLSHASSVPSLIDPVHELHILVDTVASESSYDHPTDLTVRNYRKRSHSQTQRFSLSQWVERSRRNFGRFDGLPDRFERSPTLS